MSGPVRLSGSGTRWSRAGRVSPARSGVEVRCPRTERIQQLASGEDDPALLRIRAHVDVCPQCRKVLDQITAHMAQAANLPGDAEARDKSEGWSET